jgi:hypothetical protein
MLGRVGRPVDLFSADPVLGEVDIRWLGASLSRCQLAEGLVWPGGVVMPQILGQHRGGLVRILMPSTLDMASKDAVNWPRDP